MTDREVFRRNLIDIMEETKAKQLDIAKYAQVSAQTVSAWVCGRGYPRADAMERLCKFFGIRPSALTEPKKKEISDEDRLVAAFRSLPDEGQKKLLDRANELLQLYPRRKRDA